MVLTQSHANCNAIVMYMLKISWLLTCMVLTPFTHSMAHLWQLPGLKDMAALFSCFVKQTDKGIVTMDKYLTDTHTIVQYHSIRSAPCTSADIMLTYPSV